MHELLKVNIRRLKQFTGRFNLDILKRNIESLKDKRRAKKCSHFRFHCDQFRL